MPQQEKFMAIRKGDATIEVLKVHDEKYARAAFQKMDDDALAQLAESLNLESLFEPDEIPAPTDEGYSDFIWDVVVDEAREDWNTFSYFVVTKFLGPSREDLFVSPDWPTAETFVKRMGLADSSVHNPA